MLIENTEALRGWLTTALEPICDADPAALAKYVMALLKKDKSETDLKEFCIEQLDVFLQSETRDFVDRVFEVVADRSYIPNQGGSGDTATPNKKHLTTSEPLKPSQPAVAATSAVGGQRDDQSHPSSRGAGLSSSLSSGNPSRQSSSASPSREGYHHQRRRPAPVAGPAGYSRIGAPVKEEFGSAHSSGDADRDERQSGHSSSSKRIKTEPGPEQDDSVSRSKGNRSVSNEPAPTGQALGDLSSAPANSSSKTRSSGNERRRISPPRDINSERDRSGRDRDRTARGDRPARSRSRERNGAGIASSSRRKGPASDSRGGGNRSSRYYRDRDSGRDGRRPRSRSPRTPPRRRSRSRDSSPKSSGESGGRRGTVEEATVTPTGDQNSADSTDDKEKKDLKRKKERCRDYDEKGYCMKGDRCPYDHGPDPVVVNDSALPGMIAVGGPGGGKVPAPPLPPTAPVGGGPLPNFSVPPPGYSQPPPPVPGINPPPPGVDTYAPSTVTPAGSVSSTSVSGSTSTTTVASSSGQGSTEGYNPESPAITGVSTVLPPAPLPNYSYPPPPIPMPPAWNPRPLMTPMHPYGDQHYGGGAYMSHPMQPMMVPGQKREHLITLAEGPGSPKRGRGGAGVMSRLGPRVPYHQGGIMRHQNPNAGNMNKENKTLEVRKIPPNLNNISKLNEHFGQFGQITNIQVRYEGDPEAALITFVTRIQAQTAYRSTSPILNNRFIKVFWHNPSKDEDAVAGPAGTSQDGKTEPGETGPGGRPGAGGRVQYTKVNVEERNETNPDGTRKETDSARHNPSALVPTAREIVAAQKSARRREKERRMAYLTLQKKKTDLLSKQLTQQRLLVTRMEATKDASIKKELIKMFKVMDNSVKALKTELDDLSQKLSDLSSNKNRTKEIVEKEKLDLELELMNQQQAGGDTGNLQNRLTDLKSELQNLVRTGGKEGLDDPLAAAGGTNHGGRQGNRHNRMIPKNSRLDKRPRNVVATGFSADEKDSVIAHLEKFGVMEDLEFDSKDKDGGCRALGIFKTRMDAEKAVALGGDLREDKKVKIQWGAVALTERRLSRTNSGVESVDGRKLSTSSGIEAVGADSDAEILDDKEVLRRLSSEGGESDGRRMTAEEILASIEDDLSDESGGEENKDEAFDDDDEEEEDTNEKGWKRA